LDSISIDQQLLGGQMGVAALSTLVIVGIAAGVLAGFFGVGGGVIIVPMLVYILGYDQHMASGTSLVALLAPVGILGVMAYYQSGRIGPDNIKAGLLVSLGMFAGTYFGSKIALTLPADLLRKAFAIFLVVIAVRLWMIASKG
jgi:uncharacterized membrane protein YfcA